MEVHRPSRWLTAPSSHLDSISLKLVMLAALGACVQLEGPLRTLVMSGGRLGSMSRGGGLGEGDKSRRRTRFLLFP